MFTPKGRRRAAVSAMLAAVVAAGMIVADALPAQARDDVVMLSVDDAMATPEFQQRLDGSVKFHFGNSPHGPVLTKLGDFTTNEKTNSLGKSTMTACQWVFLSALLKFQDKAQKLGANAVINIHSYFKREDVSNDTQVECHSGVFTTGVALKGDFVKIGR
jgi:hypothetical protein